MSAPAAKIMVSVGEKFACIRIAGCANFTSSIDFKTLLDELFKRGYAWFVLDLGECVLMDSTFLGVLAGLGLKINCPQPDGVDRKLELFNPNPRILELLENLGVLHLFTIADQEMKFPEKTEPCEIAPATPSRDEVKAACLEAHETLMQAHPENISRFKDLAQFLAEDLKKTSPGS
jgi:anti-anti-sigma regulatory factor